MSVNGLRGIERIEAVFSQAKLEKRTALMPYYSLGYPTPAQSLQVIEAIAQSGADIIELGFPFSDPLADGPTIQHSMQTALNQGMTIRRCIDLVKQLRQQGVDTPFILMGYINPILAFGIKEYIDAAADIKADGLIIPDLPLEESAVVERYCQQRGLALIYLLPPTAENERVKEIVSRSSGFVYLVSLTGVTGARKQLPPSLQAFVRKVRATTDLPLAVGFGVSSPQQVKEIGEVADGVIVGSALINTIDQHPDDPVSAAKEYIAELKKACQRDF